MNAKWPLRAFGGAIPSGAVRPPFRSDRGSVLVMPLRWPAPDTWMCRPSQTIPAGSKKPRPVSVWCDECGFRSAPPELGVLAALRCLAGDDFEGGAGGVGEQGHAAEAAVLRAVQHGGAHGGGLGDAGVRVCHGEVDLPVRGD